MGKRRIRTRILAVLSATLVGSLLGLLVHARGTVGQMLWHLDLTSYDYRLRGRAQDRGPSNDIVIVGVDTNALLSEAYGSWPWPRSRHAQLIDLLSEAGAKVILVDVFFDLPSTPEEDAALAAAIKRSGRVLLTAEIISEQVGTASTEEQQGAEQSEGAFRAAVEHARKPIDEFLKPARGCGVSLLPDDSDGIVRRVKLAWELPGEEREVVYITSLVAAALAQDTSPENLYRRWQPSCMPEHPWMDGDDLLIDYRRPMPEGFTYYSYAAVLDGEVPPEAFRGKVVLVGMRSGLEPDLKGHPMGLATPPSQDSTSPDEALLLEKMAGVETLAHITDMLMDGRPPRPAAVAVIVLLPVLYALVVAVCVALFRFRGGILSVPALLSVDWLSASYLFRSAGIWLPVVGVGLAVLGSYVTGAGVLWLLEERTAAFLRRAWERRVSPQVLEKILAHPELRSIPGRRVDATVVFIDLAGFTTMSARTDPVQVVGYLNRYMTLATEGALAHGGVVHKFIGDGIMMAFGEPVEIGNHAQCAVDWAYEFQVAMAGLRQSMLSEGGPELHARVGVHSGEVIAGDIGPERLSDYTIVGSAVNLASRLEGLNKKLGTTVCVSAETHARLESTRGLRHAGRHEVAGYPVPVDVYTDSPGASSSPDDHVDGPAGG